MSRSGYSDDIDQWALIKWRGQVASAIRGKRGQAFLRDLGAALDAMPEKRLIAHELRTQPPAFIPPAIATAQVCTIGSLGAARGIDLEALNPHDHHGLGGVFDIAHQLVAEIEFENDEAIWTIETPEERWKRMRAWVAANLQEPRFKAAKGRP